MNSKVDIHADDYGYSIKTSEDILDCMKQGKLDSVSIICNTVHFQKSMEMLYEQIPELPYLPLLSIHLNLPEGKGVTDLLPISWGRLFISSYTPGRTKIKDKLKQELKWQIDTTQEAIEKCMDIARKSDVKCIQKAIRIDSHIHTHPVPVVWQALIELIEEEKYDIEYIRNPKEPLLPFLKQVSLIPTYGLVNFLKNRILMFYSGKIDNYCELHKIDKMYMWGLMMSGHMDLDRVTRLYPSMMEASEKNNRVLELLFHPGKASRDEYSDEMDRNYFKDANLSDARHIEKETVMNMRELQK